MQITIQIGDREVRIQDNVLSGVDVYSAHPNGDARMLEINPASSGTMLQLRRPGGNGEGHGVPVDGDGRVVIEDN